MRTNGWILMRARSVLVKADAARDRHEWQRAAELYSEYLEMRPRRFPIWVQLGHALKESGRLLEALEAYGRALSLRADDADLLLNLGHLHRLMGHRQLAATFYERSLAADGNPLAAAEAAKMGGFVANASLAAPSNQTADRPPEGSGWQNRQHPGARLIEPAVAPHSGDRNLKIGVFTIASKNYLPFVRVLMRSLSEYNPGYRRWLCLADRIDGYYNPSDECFETIECDKIGIPCFVDMTLRYDIMEFNTAIKPFAIAYLLRQFDLDVVIYLDPDIRVFSRFEHLESILKNGASAVLIPHITRPLPDKQLPDDHTILKAGVYNLGFAAFTRSADAGSYLAWWGEKLQTLAVVDFEANLFTDQRWCDFAPCFIENLVVLRHPGYNVAYWNLAERLMSPSRNGWIVNGQPLAFFHFSGYKPNQPDTISKHQKRYSFSDRPELKPLFDEYGASLMKAGWGELREWPYAFDDTDDGLKLTAIVRKAYGAIAKEPLTLSPQNVGRTIATLLNAPSQLGSDDHGRSLTKLVEHIYRSRPDLQAAFDLGDLDGRRRLLEWFDSSARREYGISPTLYDPMEPQVARELTSSNERQTFRNRISDFDAPAPIPQLLVDAKISKLLYAVWSSRLDLQAAFDLRTPQGQRGLLGWYAGGGDIELCGGRRPALGPQAVEDGLPGATLIGYADAALGMGEQLRAMASSLEAVRLSHGVLNFTGGVESRRDESLMPRHQVQSSVYRANIFHINADQMLRPFFELGREVFENRYNVGCWAWELSQIPANWAPMVEMVDEIWACSRFIQEAYRSVATVPVVYLPQCITLPEFPRLPREKYGIPADAYVFLAMFDFHSFIDRKNPFGAVRAFRRAFGDSNRPVILVLKTMNGREQTDEWRRLLECIGEDSRIILINDTLSRSEVLGLIQCTDCFVSLHRSEGFGRVPAEAMSMGKPIIITNYSGSTDYALPQHSCLVDYQLVPVRAGEYIAGEGQVWADPDIEEAAWHMSRLAEDTSAADDLGRRGQIFIRENFSPVAVGRLYEDRLRKLRLA